MTTVDRAEYERMRRVADEQHDKYMRLAAVLGNDGEMVAVVFAATCDRPGGIHSCEYNVWTKHPACAVRALKAHLLGGGTP